MNEEYFANMKSDLEFWFIDLAIMAVLLMHASSMRNVSCASCDLTYQGSDGAGVSVRLLLIYEQGDKLGGAF